MIRGPITHLPVPGDIPRGADRRYKGSDLILEPPSLPIRVPFYNAIPAAFLPLLKGPGAPIAGSSPYRGITTNDLAPIIQKRKPWED